MIRALTHNAVTLAKKNPLFLQRGQVRERREAFLEETISSPERKPVIGLFVVALLRCSITALGLMSNKMAFE